MHGNTMARTGRKPKQRVVSLPAWALEPPIDPRLTDERGITPERAKQTGGAFVWGRDERNRQTVQTLRDSPLEAALTRKAITDRQYNAAMKYKTHWFQGGLSGSLQSIDPNRVFASDTTNFSGMAKTEAQAFHRQQYRAAIEVIGIIPAAVLDTIACHEKPLSKAGVNMGWKSKSKGIQAAEDVLCEALDKLCAHWGI